MATIIQKGGRSVPKGNYWNISNGDRVRFTEEGVLPGDARTTYVRSHPLFVLMVAPFLGLAYAAFLPFIGMAMLLTTIARKLGQMMSQSMTKSATFTWQPSEAYLAYKKKHGKEPTKEELEAEEREGEKGS